MTHTDERVEEVNYESRDYDGIRWIRLSHHEHALLAYGAEMKAEGKAEGKAEERHELRVKLLFLAQEVLAEMNKYYSIDIKFADKKVWITPSEFENMFLHRFNNAGIEAITHLTTPREDNQ